MTTTQASDFYAHFEDLVDAYVGPFTTAEECDEHAKWAKNERNDVAHYHGSVRAEDLPADPFIMTPEEDRSFLG